MSQDATFEEGREAPLYLAALDPDDLQILSALAQDAVFPITEMRWQPRARRFALLANRFRWEDLTAAERRQRTPERVQSLLVIDNVLKVASQGIDRSDSDLILSLLAVSFTPGEDGTGEVLLTLAGDGAVRLEVEALEVTLKDVTRPYAAPSRKVPKHPE
ncbi:MULTISPECIES: DUF2948 family protein [Marinovum]|jgi:hypothetical protein|uniref:DUF2948 family protein n=1 Tax=Marinovum algicola TaxID=42444 RepID=A0A975ZPI2_9RHOB|nr:MULTISPECIES: DUF2948 family protein [Marinovum]AKO95406.1 hypothetical protein MALG_00194 [Marinovum algicola DG 898]MDD9746361.1 DUF2948 family protein [Marinovum sp. PR37]SEJ87889.1 Protein of unknown function [Marinovum algicola]SLN66663.1 hypothetical protein MAA5396_03556 [Marinovum algicola]